MDNKSKNITVGLILSWLFGIFFALGGFSGIVSGEPIPGIVMMIMAAVILPPVVKFVDKKWKFHLSGGLKTVILIIGFIIFGATIETPSPEIQQTNQLKPEVITEKVEQEKITKPINEPKDNEQEAEKITEVKDQPAVIHKEEVATEPVKEINTEPEPQPTEAEKPDATGNDSIIENHCHAEWPNDAKMKAYCEKGQYDGLATLDQGKPTDITEEQFSTIRTHCKNEWPTDFKMRAYCEGQQYDGVRTLNFDKPADIGDSKFNIIRPKCKNEWITDFKMRAYCENQEYDAVRTLNNTESSKRIQCANEWPEDFKMRVYCEKN